MMNVFSVVAGITSTFGPVLSDTFAMISSANRSIGTVFPDVVVEEVHHDEMTITQQPVEEGAPVSDHAFMTPYRIEIHGMWSDSGHSAGYSKAVYEKLLALQKSAKPFSVSTGKRQYTNMLMPSLMQKTDGATEWALDVIAVCQQLIKAKATTTSAGSGGGTGGGAPSSGDPKSPSTPSGGTFDPSQTYGSGGLAASLAASGTASPDMGVASQPGLSASLGATNQPTFSVATSPVSIGTVSPSVVFK